MSAALKPITRDGKPIGYSFWCAGCEMPHVFYTAPPGKPLWDFNGNIESPTFHPSLLVEAPDHGQPNRLVCHLWLRDGMIEYLSDCTHAFASTKVALSPKPSDER